MEADPAERSLLELMTALRPVLERRGRPEDALRDLLAGARRGLGLASVAWLPRRGAIRSAGSFRAREIDWGQLARLEPGAIARPRGRTSPRSAAGLAGELWIAPPSSGAARAAGVLRLVGDAEALPSEATARELGRLVAALEGAAGDAGVLDRAVDEPSAPVARTSAGWTHDLRNQLTFALLALERVRCARGDQAGAEHLDSLEEGLRGARDACVERLGKGVVSNERAPRELRALVSAAARRGAAYARDAASVAVHVRCAEGLTSSLDENLLVRMLENLVSNAVEACSDGGHVRVDVRQDEQELVLVVDDDGRGMGAAELAAFHAPGVSGNVERGGTGYGTASLFECLQTLSAKLDIDTGPGAGTRMTIAIPTPRVVGDWPSTIGWCPWPRAAMTPSDGALWLTDVGEVERALESGCIRTLQIARGASGSEPFAGELGRLLARCDERSVAVSVVSVLA